MLRSLQPGGLLLVGGITVLRPLLFPEVCFKARVDSAVGSWRHLDVIQRFNLVLGNQRWIEGLISGSLEYNLEDNKKKNIKLSIVAFIPDKIITDYKLYLFLFIERPWSSVTK